MCKGIGRDLIFECPFLLQETRRDSQRKLNCRQASYYGIPTGVKYIYKFVHCYPRGATSLPSAYTKRMAVMI